MEFIAAAAIVMLLVCAFTGPKTKLVLAALIAVGDLMFYGALTGAERNGNGPGLALVFLIGQIVIVPSFLLMFVGGILHALVAGPSEQTASSTERPR